MSLIHPTAIIREGAVIGEDCHIGPYCQIGSEVVLGARNHLVSNVILDGQTTIGEENRFFAY
ncbi:MAG: acyl-ACP--UDP-N-acetylglucosamine O-acyltransferase, partial [Candidatus Syntrophosphaera sp.]